MRRRCRPAGARAAALDWLPHRQRQAAQVLAIERHDVRLAHHVTVNGGKRRLMVAALRYLDTFVKMDGTWFFAERGLYVDWLEERPLS